jgi:hypothetical protein
VAPLAQLTQCIITAAAAAAACFMIVMLPHIRARVMLGYFSLLIWVAVLSAAVGVYDILLVQRFRAPMLNVQSVQTFFSSITFALTLLLVFKT